MIEFYLCVLHITKMTHIQFIQNATQLPVKGIENTIALLNEDCTIPLFLDTEKIKQKFR